MWEHKIGRLLKCLLQPFLHGNRNNKRNPDGHFSEKNKKQKTKNKKKKKKKTKKNPLICVLYGFVSTSKYWNNCKYMRISVMSYVVYTFTPIVVALHKRNANTSLGKILSIFYLCIFIFIYLWIRYFNGWQLYSQLLWFKFAFVFRIIYLVTPVTFYFKRSDPLPRIQVKINWYLQKLSSGNENTDLSRADNSVKNWRNLLINNPKPENPLHLLKLSSGNENTDGRKDVPTFRHLLGIFFANKTTVR